MSSRFSHPLTAVAIAVVVTLPWVAAWVTGAASGLGHLGTVVVSGLAVLGASFLLAWGAETAEKDVPRAFALAVLAVLAVAPEYAVDALYAWQAATDPSKANLAVANMTGANRILIGLGWSGIALFSIFKAIRGRDDTSVVNRDGYLRDAVTLDPSISTEILFLFIATVYAFFVPIGAGIDWVDTVVLVGLYVTYIAIIIRGDVDEHDEQVGVPAYFQAKPKVARFASVLGLFAYSAFLIFTAVEPFAHGLEELGLQFGIPEFFMIQWIAPLASESPELIVTAYLVNKARSTAAFNALISSKLNQWTLLIGTLVVVYSISLGQYGKLPFDLKQEAEIWLTAAQSFFALTVLVNFQIDVREAVTLLVLFVSQVVVEFAIIRTFPEAVAESHSINLLLAYTAIYLLIGVVLLVKRREDLKRLASLTVRNVRGEPTPEPGGAD
ncbi:sodium:calcium antiporter [Halogeometricum borinquense]|uniref:Ca2+/Na+ antiporter n=2 Tax=Halogeometricum borinquense TaxID=60847 RepID=E4NS11_HALBP|nr:sodium:calcium antiporter [Halogeometricum borinquense]ADQ68057.1 Ca2+/Na+ antiporter [Halogeometricum borinquense DSM 11551]RYJ13028.1 sodium:calcium antiporter [Halogeometricum borinquense]